MATPVCWLFFAPVLSPGGPADFAGHCHDVEYIGDCPQHGFLVPCDVCLVNSEAQVLTYDTSVTPPNQAGVIVTRL